MKINIDKSKYTPMMQQYLTIKENYQDAFVFFRLGDFYELFFDDAIKASNILEIALTGREAGGAERVPMCGVPHHSAANYIEKLVSFGYKVAIVEQVEEASKAKGLVKRDVVRMITPGTITDASSLRDNQNNYIAVILDYKTNYSFSYADLSTGDIYSTLLDYNVDAVINEIMSLQIKEVIIGENIHLKIIKALNIENVSISHYENKGEVFNIDHLLEELTDIREKECTSLLVNYLLGTQKQSLVHMKKVVHYDINNFMTIDIHSKFNLEIFETIRNKTKNGSLLSVIDKTKTAMGGRILKKWLDRPLIEKEKIIERNDMVDYFRDNLIIKEEIINALKKVYDLERLVGRVSFGNANSRDLLQLKTSIEQFPIISNLLLDTKEDIITKLFNGFSNCDDLYNLLNNSIGDTPPLSIKDGGIIKRGYNEELDKLTDASINGKKWIAEYEAKERERTGVKSLKVKFNKIFGYFIEITKSNIHLITEEMKYERKQTLSNGERYITEELKEMENIILGAEEKAIKLEYELFIAIREHIKNYISVLQHNAVIIAQLDCLVSFAHVADELGYIRPVFNDDRVIEIKDSRHPVVEQVLTDAEFIKNDILMDQDTNVYLITGPNMSGKSTYMRQLALTVILAQIGCFVPASSAMLPIFDKIFTRIGAADDLISGQSTFMVEMMETNNALHNSTSSSLILLDEIGRGTATYDGMALAQAIIEYIHNRIGAKTLFSTHYHELVDLEEYLPKLKNIHVKAEERNDDIVFLHKVEKGPTDKSYGVEVAKLAKLPVTVIKRAEEILIKLESMSKEEKINEEITLFNYNFEQVDESSEIIDALKAINVNNITPIEALNLLFELKSKVDSK